MCVPAAVSGLRGVTNSMGKQYVSGVRRKTSFCEVARMPVLRTGDIG